MLLSEALRIKGDSEVLKIEMNTRIQVEHPVTEEITGLDLVKYQILLAAGERLNLRQEDITFRGHSLECRINCEDPQNNFLPTPGRIDSLILPGGRGVRVDTAVYQGWMVPPYYDSLLAKLIVKGSTRDECIQIMRRALEEFVVHPLKTTVELHRTILNDRDFIKGEYNTSFLERFYKEGTEE